MSRLAPAVREAIVLVGAGDACHEIARVPLLTRTLRALEQVGCERCTLVGSDLPADVSTRLVLSGAPTLIPCADAALRVLVGPGVVLDLTFLRSLIADARDGEVLDVEAAGARVRLAPGRRITDAPTRRCLPRAGVLMARTTSPKVVEHALLLGLENPRDGYLDRLINRRLSRPLTRLLLRTSLSPNMVTVIGIVFGVLGGLLLGAPGIIGVVLGIVCLVLSGVLDCSDGELARLRFAESKFGHLLDVTGDTVVHGALLAGIVRYLVRTGAAPSWSLVGLLALGVLGAFAAISWSEATEFRRHRIQGWENRILDAVLSPLSTRDWHVFVVAFALAGCLDRLVVGAAIGAHVFWVAVAVLVVRVLGREPTRLP